MDREVKQSKKLGRKSSTKRHSKPVHELFEDAGPIEDEEAEEDTQFEWETDQPPKWYMEFENIDSSSRNELSKDASDKLKTEASVLFRTAVTNNTSKKPKSMLKSDYLWIKTVMAKGTMSDKVAAYTLLIQDSPVYNLSLLKTLISLVKVAKNKECFLAVDTLHELFLNELLPPNRKLIPFSNQPLSKLDEIFGENYKQRKHCLILWYFEEQLKEAYREFILMLNHIAHDSVEANKEKAIAAMYKLLAGNPEQESALLSHIVNKLGDPNHKVGSKVIYTLTKLLQVHPVMNQVVMEEVEKVIFRPNISKRAQYYSVCFLTQFILSNEESVLAKSLISIYFSLFKACVKSGEIDSRLMSALLTGVNRAYPYAKAEVGALTEHVDTMYRVVHLSTPIVSIHALHLLLLTSDSNASISDRYLTVLYKKIGDPAMYRSSHHAVFLSLIFKAMKKDQDKNRNCVFIKRLLQMCLNQTTPMACGILIIVSEIIREKDLLRVSYQPDKRLNKFSQLDADDDDEHYEDVQMDGQLIQQRQPQQNNIDVMMNVDTEPKAKQPEDIKPNTRKTYSGYDAYHRNPLHDNGTCIYSELSSLLKHFHPTVALFATNILNGHKITYPGDPLQDFTLIRFLDRFVYKNPKTSLPEEKKTATFSIFGRKKYYVTSRMRRLRANTANYLNTNEKSVPEDERFLYDYLNAKRDRTQTDVKEEKGEDDDSDGDSVGSNEFDEFLEELMGTKEEDVNFLNEAGELTKKQDKKKGKQNVNKTLEAETNDDLEGSDDSDSADLDSEPDMGGEDEDEDFMEGSELDPAEAADLEFRLQELNIPLKKGSAAKSKGKKKPFKNSGIFAAAEEFAEILEEPTFNAGTSETLSNKDNADIKQLKWETKRHDWIQNKNFKRKNFGSKKDHRGGKKRKMK